MHREWMMRTAIAVVAEPPYLRPCSSFEVHCCNALNYWLIYINHWLIKIFYMHCRRQVNLRLKYANRLGRKDRLFFEHPDVACLALIVSSGCFFYFHLSFAFICLYSPIYWSPVWAVTHTCGTWPQIGSFLPFSASGHPSHHYGLCPFVSYYLQ